MFTYLLRRNEMDIKLTFAQSNLTLLVVLKTKDFVQVLMMNRLATEEYHAKIHNHQCNILNLNQNYRKV